MRFRELLRRSQTRINLLFTMSEIPQARPLGQRMRSDVFADDLFEVISSILNSIWWSQTGSNRRPHACKARALPAELWPRTRRRMLLLRSPSLALRRSSLRSRGPAEPKLQSSEGWWAWGSSLRSRGPAEPKLQSSEGWWAWEDLNFRPHAYQARALTN